MPPTRRRFDRSTVLTLLALALATAFVLAETVALRDAGRRLRAQEAAERAARDSVARAGTARASDARATTASP